MILTLTPCSLAYSQTRFSRPHAHKRKVVVWLRETTRLAHAIKHCIYFIYQILMASLSFIQLGRGNQVNIATTCFCTCRIVAAILCLCRVQIGLDSRDCKRHTGKMHRIFHTFLWCMTFIATTIQPPFLALVS